MKKLISALIVIAMLVATLALTVSAAQESPEGNIAVSIPEAATENAVFVDKEGNEVKLDITAFEVTKEDGTKETVDLTAYISIIKVKKVVLAAAAGVDIYVEDEAISASWAKKLSGSKDIVAAFGDEYKDYKVYTLFQVEFSEEGQDILGDYTLKNIPIQVETEGITNANNATVFHYNAKSDSFAVVDAKVDSKTNNIDMTAEFDADGVGRYGILYVPTSQSPSTAVETYVIFALVAVFALAVAGAAVAGKKAFAKR